MNKTPYAICRTEKLHFQDLSKASNHNFRSSPVANANASKTILPMMGSTTGTAFVSEVTQRFQDWKARKLAAHTGKRGAKMARDPVVCVEVLLTASPEYFRPTQPDQAGYWEADKLEAWKQTVQRFASSYFGSNLVAVILHLDEATPHAHCLCMPFDKEGNLNAKRTFNRANLIKLQDAYADACKPLGLQRGLRGSTATHEDIKDFYGLVNRETPPVSTKKLKPAAIDLPGKVERLNDEKLEAFAESIFKQGVNAASIVYEKKLEAVSAKANAFDLAQRREDDTSHALQKARQLASEVRVIALEEVLKRLGATPATNQLNTWVMPGRTLSVTGSKFFDSVANQRGSGAIDLIKHCEGVDYNRAVQWLALEFGKTQTVGEAVRATQEKVAETSNQPQPLPVPESAPQHLSQVVDYLHQRHIAPEVVAPLIEKGKLFADQYANCVFKRQNMAKEEGAEIVGTQGAPFHSSRGNSGAFVLPPKDKSSKQAIFVRSAIDALSYRTLNPLCGWVFSVAGQMVKQVRLLARELMAQGFSIISAFGKSAQDALLTLGLKEEGISSQSIPTQGDDWNEALTLREQLKKQAMRTDTSKLTLRPK